MTKAQSLQAVMAATMFDDAKLRARFEQACKPTSDKPLAAWAKLYGWTPPRELAEWQAVAPAYGKLFESIPDVWMLRDVPPAKQVDITHDLLTLVTGLRHFGDDPSGDTCFVSTLPHAGGVAEVHVFDHESGELGEPNESIAMFVAEKWGEVEVDEATSKQRGQALFERMKWMWSFGSGETGYHFAEDMAKAPAFETWTIEKKKLTPHLANYWLLAHYFLGNAAACAEAVALAKKQPGTFTSALAKLVAALLADPSKTKLGPLTPSVLAELRAAVAKNADENLLEPALRGAVTAARSSGVTKADAAQIKKRLAAGEDGWALIGEFPDDVATHDLVLAALAKQDKKLAETVKRYTQQRAEDSIWTKWPSDYPKTERATFDRRLSPVIGATFRAGLTFDADHKRAAPALVTTLAFLDDDIAMKSFAAAIEACRMDDERLQYVVGALRASKHPGAQDVLARAAWRFFELFDATKKSMKKTEKQGPTLDNMFRTHSHLLVALVVRMRTGDDESEKLVDKVLSVHEDMRVLGVAYAAAFAQVAEKKLERHGSLASIYCKVMFALEGECLADESLYNLADAALAFATLHPDTAEPQLRAQLLPDAGARATTLQLDKIACALAGLLYLAPSDPQLLAWTERILGNRSGSQRVYGPLRGIAAGRVTAAKPWIGWHCYHGCSSNHIGEKPGILRAARAALVALGEPEPPPFDESDEFANERTDADLPVALTERHRHLLDWTFKRIVERELRSPEVVASAGAVLRDLFRFSADAASYAPDSKEGLSCMLYQGAPALPELASLLALPHASGADKTVIAYVMTLVEPGPAVLARFACASDDELLAALVPHASTIGTLDVAAAFAIASLGARAHAAIEAAARWRFSLVDREADADHWLEDEPVASHLARIAATLPNGKSLLAELGDGDNYHLTEVIKSARGVKPSATLDMNGAGERTFAKHMKEHGGPKYEYKLAIDGAKLAIDLRVEDIYVQGILDESRFEQHGAIDARTPEDARTIADRIARALGVLGFAPKDPPKQTKPAKRPAGSKPANKPAGKRR